MVSRDTKETALLVVLAVVGFVVASALNAPEVVDWTILVVFGVIAPLARDEWRRRQEA